MVPACCTVDGPGLRGAVSGPVTSNTIIISLRDASGRATSAPKEAIDVVFAREPNDARAYAPAMCGVRHEHGYATVSYVLTDGDLSNLHVRIVINGISVCACVVPVWAGHIAGEHVLSYAMVDGAKYGLALTPDSVHMLVTCFSDHKLRVYALQPTFSLVRTIGGWGSGPAQFKGPVKLRWTPGDSIMVCDSWNHRVQEVTLDGDYVREIPITDAWTIDIFEDTVAIGTGVCTVVLFAYSTGLKLLTIGEPGSGPGQIGSYGEGIRWSADGSRLIVCEYYNKRISVFTATGEFVKFIGIGVVSDGSKDVIVAPNGELLVADFNNNCMYVFDSEGDTLLRQWGRKGDAPGEFQRPTALALLGKQLLVLDFDSPRVQVFE